MFVRKTGRVKMELRNFLVEFCQDVNCSKQGKHTRIEHIDELVKNQKKTRHGAVDVVNYLFSELNTSPLCTNVGVTQGNSPIDLEYTMNGQSKSRTIEIKFIDNFQKEWKNPKKPKHFSSVDDLLVIDKKKSCIFLVDTPSKMTTWDPNYQLLPALVSKIAPLKISNPRTLSPFPEINEPLMSFDSSKSSAYPLLYPNDFVTFMKAYLPGMIQEFVNQIESDNRLSLSSAPIMYVDDILRDFNEELVNEQEKADVFPAVQYPELTYLLRYLTIVEGEPSIFCDGNQNFNTSSLRYSSEKLFEALEMWIENLEKSKSEGAGKMAIRLDSTTFQSEHHLSNIDDFWKKKNKNSMANAIGYVNDTEAEPILEQLGIVLSERFPFLARTDGWVNENNSAFVGQWDSPYNPPLPNPPRAHPDPILSIEALLGVMDSAKNLCPPQQKDYSTSRGKCSDFDGRSNNDNGVHGSLFSLCDALQHILGPPTDRFSSSSNCFDAWKIDDVLEKLKTIQNQITPISASARKRVFLSVTESWKYLAPNHQPELSKRIEQAESELKLQGASDAEISTLKSLIRNNGLILLNIKKAHESAIHRLGAFHTFRRMFEQYGEMLSHQLGEAVFPERYVGKKNPGVQNIAPIEQDIENWLQNRGETITGYAANFALFSLFSGLTKSELCMGTNNAGKTNRLVQTHSTGNVVLDGISMGIALRIMDEMNVPSHVDSLLEFLAIGNKNIIATLSGKVTNGPAVWRLMELFSSSSIEPIELLLRWHTVFRAIDADDDGYLMNSIINRTKNNLIDEPWNFFHPTQ